MATTQLDTIKVDELSKFGFKSNGEYINWSKTIKETDKVGVVPGRTFQMELYIADSGKKYVNKVLNIVESADVPAPKKAATRTAPTVAAPKAVAKTEDAPMTRTDWDAKDRRISRQGVIQAAVQAVSGYSTADDVFENARELADKMLSFVNEK